ncbi:SDR family NAD(P)-dependent oxidoreductase [Streptomyces sp. CA-251387]|uniref:SDR family NAD(P)-dependent oxidoreductase n=1 Tax=Streptomyces sp. CA-251387 TaxID=3240064 RepID=UPI003D946CC9
MTSIAIVGAGPPLGLAIARTFGGQGMDVALISRSREKLDGLVGNLSAGGITAAAFPADVLDRDALTEALKDAAARFGRIDVLEYSPLAIEFQLYGAMAATQAVLPAMREASTGTLLYTTGAGSLDPLPVVGNVNAAAAALRAAHHQARPGRDRLQGLRPFPHPRQVHWKYAHASQVTANRALELLSHPRGWQPRARAPTTPTPQIHRILHRKFSTLLGGRNTIEHHDQLIDVCAGGDARAAAELSGQHWSELGGHINQLFDNNQFTESALA